MSRDEWTVRDSLDQIRCDLGTIFGSVDDGVASVAGQIGGLRDAICRERTNYDKATGVALDLTEAVGYAGHGVNRIADALERIADALEKK